MTRFVLRNYGKARSLPYKGRSYFIGSDGVIETDNPELVSVLTTFPDITVTERHGDLSLTPPPPPDDDEEEPEDEEEDDDEDDDFNEDEDDDDDSGEDEDEDDNIDYDSLLKRELLAIAKERGIELPGKITKAGLIVLLKEKSGEKT